jgi:hypothetical protein
VRSALAGLTGVNDVLAAQLLRCTEGTLGGMFICSFAATVVADAADVKQRQLTARKPSFVVVFSAAVLLCEQAQGGTWSAVQVLRCAWSGTRFIAASG